MTWLLVHENTQYVRSMFQIITWRLYQMYFTCYRCQHMRILYQMHDLYVTGLYMMIIGKVHDLHVTGITTWWLNHLHNNCKLRVLVHDYCTILHNCMIWDCYNNITNWDCEHGISYYSTYCSQLFFSHWSFLYGFRFFSFLLSYLQFEFLCMSAVPDELGLENVQFSNCSITTSTQIFNFNLELGTWTGTRIFDWDPDIWRGGHVFTTAKLILCNMLNHTVI